MDPAKRKGRAAFIFNLTEMTMLGVWIRWPLLQHAYDFPELYPDYYAEYSQALLYFVYFSSVISLLLTHILPPGKAKPYQLNAEFTFCERCSIERAPRAHHCSTCQSCILRLDHHCIWIHNCVGLYNIKYFYLYLISISVIFTQMGTLTYDYYFLCYTFTFNSPDYLQTVLLKIGFYITGLICLMFTFGIFFLIYFQFNALYSNITSIEVIKGIATIRSRPLCLQFETVHVTYN